MAKTIKFNLICDGKPIRTIEELQENFSIQDVLKYYDNSLLLRWLEVRGYKEEAERVSAIKAESAVEKIKELADVFLITDEKSKIEECAYIFEYMENRQKMYERYEKEKVDVNQIINDYKSGYAKLVDDIINNPEDIVMIKANIQEIVANYKWVFKLNHRNLFYLFWDKAPVAILCLLMNKDTRDFYLPVDMIDENGKVFLDIDVKKCEDKKIMYQSIVKMVEYVEFKKKFEKYLRIFSARTDGYWKDVEEKGKQYMIISMGRGNWVRSTGVFQGDLSFYDVKNKFVILNGIDYKSNSEMDELVYMEV